MGLILLAALASMSAAPQVQAKSKTHPPAKSRAATTRSHWVPAATAQVAVATKAAPQVQRLATSTPLDKRISYGCINVPARFFENVVRPAFTKTNGIVYVLPETKSVREIFASYYDVE